MKKLFFVTVLFFNAMSFASQSGQTSKHNQKFRISFDELDGVKKDLKNVLPLLYVYFGTPQQPQKECSLFKRITPKDFGRCEVFFQENDPRLMVVDDKQQNVSFNVEFTDCSSR